MHACEIGRIDAPVPEERAPGARGILTRLGVAVMMLIAAVMLLPGAARAAGTLSSGDYTGPEGTQHYELYVPSSYKPGTPVPLVVALHGCTETADQFRLLSHWDALAEQKGFIVLFPQQDPNANYLKCWDFFQDGSMHRSAGEPARIAAATTMVERNYTIDAHRVYASGFSAGGAMASVMAATYPDLFAAIGIGSGCEYAATATCAGYKSADPNQAGQQAYKEMGSHARPMPFINFEGDADTTVPPVNADQLVQQWLITDDLADDGILNNSVPTYPTFPAKTTQGQVPGGRSYTTRTYLDHNHTELAQYWTIRGMNHAWSGGSASQSYSDPSGPDETAAMYAFFTNHPFVGTPMSPWAGIATAAAKPGVPTVSKPKLSHGKIVFTISGPGKVTLLLQRSVTGHLNNGRCVTGKHKTHKCTKYSTKAKIVHTATKAGRIAITLPKKIHGHRLTHGRYHAVVTPGDTAGHTGKSRTVSVVLP
jgi:poly(hydroxyalkanoate) depolymerase family esterase